MNSVTGFVVSRRIKLKDNFKNLEEDVGWRAMRCGFGGRSYTFLGLTKSVTRNY